MGVCIQCDSEALKDSDFCAACEEREFKKIRGWLYVPALGLVLSIIVNMVAINFNIRFLLEHFPAIGSTQKAILFFGAVCVCGYVRFCCLHQQPVFP